MYREARPDDRIMLPTVLAKVLSSQAAKWGHFSREAVSGGGLGPELSRVRAVNL